jgi:hypothetical protein
MIDELTDAVARAGGLSQLQANQAVAAMLRFMAARLPSPLFGELQERLHPRAQPQAPRGDATKP